VQGYQRRSLRQNRLARRLESEAVVEINAGDPADAGRIDLALSRLSAPDQELLRLVEWDRLALPDVAALVGCSVAALRVRLHRARRRFRSEYERQGDVVDDGGHARPVDAPAGPSPRVEPGAIR
jgi:DNA-directed RNA polymerase specialized sigma24 family protein